jgi:hypothetical protein
MEGNNPMNPLLDEYFQRDLDGAEEEGLAQWLASSPEGTQEFIARMEVHYRGWAAPSDDPAWPEGPLPDFFPKPSQAWRWTLLGLFLVLALGFLGYHSFHPSAAPSGLPAPPRTGPRPSEVIGPKIPSHPTAPATVRPRSPIGVHKELSISVENLRTGLVTVRVFDDQGREVRSLYAGILPAGQRTFSWDGKDGQGIAIAPGTYTLEVASGGRTYRKTVHIRSLGNGPGT